MSAQQPFSARLVAGLVAAGLVAFAALVLLIAYGDRMAPVRAEAAPAYSVSATGYKALIDLLGRFRTTAMIAREAELSTENLVIVPLDLRDRPEAVARLLERRAGRATLLIMPKWLTWPDRWHRGWAGTAVPLAGQLGQGLLGKGFRVRVSPAEVPTDRFAAGQDILDGAEVPVPGNGQTISAADLAPLLTLPNGDVLLARLGDQPHYVAADPDLFNNHGLKDPA